jgi:hypothetical protein
MSFRTALLALLAGACAFAAPARAAPMHPFYPYTHAVTTKAQYLARIGSPRFKVDRRAFVRLFDREVGPAIGVRVASFEEYADFVRSDAVTVRPCGGDADSRMTLYSVDSSGSRFGTASRSCKPGELVLAYHGQAIASLYCGNLVEVAAPPPPPPRRLHHRADCDCDCGLDEGFVPSQTFYLE